VVEERDILEHPTIQRRVIDLNAALLHHLLELTIADRIGHVPPHAPQDHLPLEVATLELDHRPSSHEAVAGDLMPSRNYSKICDRTRDFP
jgi:hypothetical protein